MLHGRFSEAVDADLVLGLDLHQVSDEPAGQTDELPDGAQQLLGERSAARADGDYGRADWLRAELLALGVEPIDRADGPPGWRRR